MKKFLALFLILLAFGCANKQTVKPADSPLDSEQEFAKANSLMQKKQFDKAREVLLGLRSRDMSGKYAPLAELRIADTYFNQGEYDSAVEGYKKFLDRYPDHMYAPYAQYQIGMSYFQQIQDPERGSGEAKKALMEFERLKSLYPRNPYKQILDLRITRCRDTIAAYEFMVGKFYYHRKAYVGAISRFKEILKSHPEYIKTPEILYLTALSYKKLGDKAKAEEYLARLSTKYPDGGGLVKKASREIK